MFVSDMNIAWRLTLHNCTRKSTHTCIRIPFEAVLRAMHRGRCIPGAKAEPVATHASDTASICFMCAICASDCQVESGGGALNNHMLPSVQCRGCRAEGICCGKVDP